MAVKTHVTSTGFFWVMLAEASLVSREPQYQRATAYICCVPWMTQARYTQDLMGEPPDQSETSA
jgi:hypothetical protein